MFVSTDLPLAAEAILSRASGALVPDHADLVDGLEHLNRLRQSAERGNPGQIMLLTGESGSGKTTLVRWFIEQERVRIRRESGRSASIGFDGLVLSDGPSGDERPVVYVSVPSTQSQSALAAAILRAYGAQAPDQLRKHQILGRLRAQIVGQKTKVLILDEFHHCVDEDRDRVVRTLSELVKDLLVSTKVHIVIAGMGLASKPVDQSKQLNRRCKVRFPLAPFGWGESGVEQEEFRSFLRGWEAAMDLPEPSYLDEPARASRIHRATGGLIGFAARLVLNALEYGLERGIARIDDHFLAHVYDETRLPEDRTNPFREALVGEEEARLESVGASLVALEPTDTDITGGRGRRQISSEGARGKPDRGGAKKAPARSRAANGPAAA
ncbi:AAA family ATPase [Methylorubrum thiocyanatum]|uniref:AAA family ATPase n=1 Tax=Methylorubrum thiocyanatum TaxID=47958 RepID=UPI00383B9B82